MSSTEKVIPIAEVPEGNCLIERLPKRQRDSVLAQCDTVDLAFGSVLCEAGAPFEHVYFPLSGSISLIRSIDGHEAFETEHIGREGMLGAVLILDVNLAPQRGVVHTVGRALRMESRRVAEVLHENPALLRLLQRYLYVVLSELSQSAGCVRFHDVGGRLARGLLLAHDRVQANDLPLLTHKLLAEMLGVQRGSVTIAAARLQREGIIRYSRGKICILDRERLEAAACGCYATSIDTYGGVLAQLPVEDAGNR